jgi:hypothetical protein
MLTNPVTIAALTGFFTLCGAGLTSLTQIINTQRSQRFELRKENSRLESETSRERSELVREKLEKSHIILSEISREFSITFLTIDRSANMSPIDFHNKYRDLCAKVDQVQMIIDFYAPSVRGSVEELYGFMNHYWGHFHTVLAIDEKGGMVDHTTLSFSEAMKYSRKIQGKAYEIQEKISEIAYSVMYPE